MTTCPDPGKAVGVEDRMVYLGSGLFYPPFRPFQIAFLSLINAAVPPQPHRNVRLSKLWSCRRVGADRASSPRPSSCSLMIVSHASRRSLVKNLEIKNSSIK